MRMCSPVIPLVDLIEIIPNHFITTLLNESFDLQGVLLSEYVYDCDLLFTDHPMTRVVDILRHLSRVYAEEPFTKMDLYLDETLTRGEFSQLGNLLIESDVSKWLNIQEPPFNVSILEACLQKPELFKVFDPTLYSIKDVLQFLDSLDVNISSEIFEDSVAGHGLQFFSLEKSSTEAILFDSKCEWCPSLEAFSQYLNQHTKLVCKYIEQGMNHALYRVYWGDSGWVTDFEVYGESSTGGMFDDGGISTSTYLVSNPLLTEVMNWQEQGNAFVSSLKQILAGEHSDLSFEDVSLHCVLERPSLQDLESNTHTYSILEEQSQYFLECQGLYFHLYKDSRYRVNITEDIDCFLDWIERNKRRAENDGFVIAGTKSPKAGERSMEELSTSEQELLINVVGRLSQLNVDPVIIAKGTGLSIKTVSRYLDK